jgi:hypothetical protein
MPVCSRNSPANSSLQCACSLGYGSTPTARRSSGHVDQTHSLAELNDAARAADACHHPTTGHGKSLRHLLQQCSLNTEADDPRAISTIAAGCGKRHARSKRRLRLRYAYQEDLVESSRNFADPRSQSAGAAARGKGCALCAVAR